MASVSPNSAEKVTIAWIVIRCEYTKSARITDTLIIDSIQKKRREWRPISLDRPERAKTNNGKCTCTKPF